MHDRIEVLARIGYAARGVVYLIVGFFAVLAAFGRSEVKGTAGALQELLAQPFGTILVGLVAVGLLAFCVWRLVQGLADTDEHGRDGKGILVRAGLIGSGLSYAALGLLAVGLASGSRSGAEGSSGDPSGRWLAEAHELGIGWLIVYGVAAIFFAVGVAHIVKGWKAGFEKYFRCPDQIMRWLKPFGRFGLIARGAVFVIIAALIFSGGLAYQASERPGLGEALQAVQGYSFGWLILLAVALGLVAFGAYSLAEARYRSVTAR